MAIYTDLKINLQPGAKEDLICCWMVNGALKIKIRGKPIKGRANQDLLKFLAKSLRMRRSEVEIISGEKSRKKRIRFWGIADSALKSEINKLINQDP
jgi:uncharacterized protein (TIGR00251 family)